MVNKISDKICNVYADLVVLIQQDKYFVTTATSEVGKRDFFPLFSNRINKYSLVFCNVTLNTHIHSLWLSRYLCF